VVAAGVDDSDKDDVVEGVDEVSEETRYNPSIRLQPYRVWALSSR
jgi:hypothetical protein